MIFTPIIEEKNKKIKRLELLLIHVISTLTWVRNEKTIITGSPIDVDLLLDKIEEELDNND